MRSQIVPLTTSAVFWPDWCNLLKDEVKTSGLRERFPKPQFGWKTMVVTAAVLKVYVQMVEL